MYFKNWMAIVVFFTFAGCKQTLKPSSVEHVIVIGVDGMSPDGIRNANTPTIDNLVKTGAVKWNVRTVLPSSSSQNWASMIMGAGSEVHGVIDNDWELNDHTLPPITAGDAGIFPTIFQILREQQPNAEIGAVYNWSGFGRLFEKQAVNFDKTYSTEDSTANAFAAYIKDKKPTLGFVHLDHVDHAGHDTGHGTPTYYSSIEKTDTLVQVIVDAIKDAGIADKTLIIITSDHGGKGKGHGGATPEEAEIAMILTGAGTKNGYIIQQQVYTYDLAATIAFALGVTPPYAWTGRPIKAAFNGFNEPDNLWVGKSLLPTPVIHPKRNMNNQAGGLFVDTPAEVVIQPMSEEAEIYYTINGDIPDKNATLYTGPFTVNNTSVVQARAFDGKGNESMTDVAYFRLVNSNASNGVSVAYYHGKNLKSVPNFATLKPALQWQEYEFRIEEEKTAPLQEMNGNKSFATVLKSNLQIDVPGTYRFYLQSDDGSILYINDQKVVDNDGTHGVREASGEIELTAGKHAISVAHFNGIGGFWLEVFYKPPGQPKQIIPADKLFTQP